MRLRQLQTFCDLARTLNFTQTAQRMHYAQSSVMEQIDALENHFGVPLFARRGRRLSLTPAGEQLLGYAERILELADEARARIGRVDRQKLEIIVMAPETFCVRRLPRVLKEFHEISPDVVVHVRVGSKAALATAVSNNAADICVALGDAVAQVEGNGNGVQVTRLGNEPLLLVAVATHPLVGNVVTLEKLTEFPLYATQVGCAFRAAQDAVLGRAGAVPGVVVESIAMLVECVATTNGVALLPEMAVEDALAQKRLATIDILADAPLVTPLHMLWRGRSAAPHVRRFAEMLRSEFADDGQAAEIPETF